MKDYYEAAVKLLDLFEDKEKEKYLNTLFKFDEMRIIKFDKNVLRIKHDFIIQMWMNDNGIPREQTNPLFYYLNGLPKVLQAIIREEMSKNKYKLHTLLSRALYANSKEDAIDRVWNRQKTLPERLIETNRMIMGLSNTLKDMPPDNDTMREQAIQFMKESRPFLKPSLRDRLDVILQDYQKKYPPQGSRNQ